MITIAMPNLAISFINLHIKTEEAYLKKYRSEFELREKQIEEQKKATEDFYKKIEEAAPEYAKRFYEETDTEYIIRGHEKDVFIGANQIDEYANSIPDTPEYEPFEDLKSLEPPDCVVKSSYYLFDKSPKAGVTHDESTGWKSVYKVTQDIYVSKKYIDNSQTSISDRVLAMYKQDATDIAREFGIEEEQVEITRVTSYEDYIDKCDNKIDIIRIFLILIYTYWVYVIFVFIKVKFKSIKRANETKSCEQQQYLLVDVAVDGKSEQQTFRTDRIDLKPGDRVDVKKNNEIINGTILNCYFKRESELEHNILFYDYI